VIPAARAEGSSDTHFVRTLCNRVRNGAIDADGGEQHCQTAEHSQQDGAQAVAAERLGLDLLQKLDVIESLILVQLPNGSLDSFDEALGSRAPRTIKATPIAGLCLYET
jgi:hypothetical protein